MELKVLPAFLGGIERNSARGTLESRFIHGYFVLSDGEAWKGVVARVIRCCGTRHSGGDAFRRSLGSANGSTGSIRDETGKTGQVGLGSQAWAGREQA